MKRKSVLCVVMFCFVAMGLAVAPPGAAAKMETVKVAVLSGTQLFPVYVMEKMGYAKKYGLNIDRVDIIRVAGLYTALTGKKVDFGFGGFASAALFRTKGKDVVSIYSFNINNNDLLVKLESPILSISDLKGKEIGIYGGPAGSSTVSFKIIAKRYYGVDLDKDCKIHYGAPPLLAGMLKKGEIDALFTLDPHTTKLILGGGIRSVARIDDEWKKYHDTPLLLVTIWSNDEFLAKHPKAATKLIRAYRDSVAYLGSHPEIWPELAASVGIKDERGARILAERLRYIFVDKWDDEIINQHKMIIRQGIEMFGERFMKYLPEGGFTTKYVPKD